MSRYDCEVITQLERLDALEPTWSKLLSSSPGWTPWQDLPFLRAWWSELAGTGRKLRVFVVTRDGTPCLLAPLQISRRLPMPVGIGLRLLEPIGMLADVNRPRLAIGEDDPLAYECLLDAIWERRAEWDAVGLDEKSWDDAEAAHLRDWAVQRECIFRQGFSHPVPRVDLTHEWPAFLASRSRAVRKNLRAARRRLEALGAVAMDLCRGPDEVERGVDTLIALHERSWKSTGGIEHARSPAYRRFFRRWLLALALEDRARIRILTCGGRPVAATAGILAAGTHYGMQIVYDESYAACSPGTLLVSLEIEQLMQERSASVYDMMGSYAEAKRIWTDDAPAGTHVFVLQRSVRCWLADAWYFLVKPYVRPAILRLARRRRAGGAGDAAPTQ